MNVYSITIVIWIAFVIDLILGDPRALYHPIIAIGKLISVLEKKVLRKREPKKEGTLIFLGAIEAILVCLLCFVIPFMAIYLLGKIYAPLALVLSIFWCWQLIAAKSLKDAGMDVYKALQTGVIDDARYAVSMIVGRDTQSLTREGVIKATVETIAENTSDGVVAPLFYMMLGGVPLMYVYKGINTMDSMLGYKNDRYLYYGRIPAKLDDVANLIPARLSAIFMIAGCFVLQFFDSKISAKNALKIFLRDRYHHSSPNSAQTESVVAGALGVQLAGDASYFGKKVKKPTIGDPGRSIEAEDIVRANRIMIVASVITAIVFGLIAFLIQQGLR